MVAYYFVKKKFEKLKYLVQVNYVKPSAPTVVIPIITVPPSQPAKTPASSPAPPPTSKTKPTPIVKSWKDCIPLCIYRCKLHLRKMVCITACMTCCDRCKCVPLDQTYGNRDKCGKCYTDMLTHHDKVKCP
ncbi:putative gibberellin regulated protein [Medicago truncatula]|uniref:Putative gibberellin regulated protein n=1 Tax=Medicago truncatula TaxID=3880 RepID=A0A396H9C2_MEDTR|nr:putative gibberellin regulated protein [Medicago truncatula]